MMYRQQSRDPVAIARTFLKQGIRPDQMLIQFANGEEQVTPARGLIAHTDRGDIGEALHVAPMTHALPVRW